MAPASPPSHHETCPNDLHVFHANAKSSPLARSHKVKRKPIPTATTHRAYRIVDTEESLSEYKNKDGEKDWPTKPQLLRKRTTRTYFVLCWDVLVTLLPVVFLVFAACALSLDKKQLSKFGANIRKGNTLGPTVFPIVFAAIAARLMKGIALRRAERGTELGLLEQLIGSQSLAGAIERIVLLRRFGIIGTTIIILWLLSPLGGQCSLRILAIANTNITEQRHIYYFNVSSTLSYNKSSFSSSISLDIDAPILRAQLLASLIEPDSVLDSPVDLWNNVKLPRLDELSPFKDPAPGNPWIFINKTADTVWSSLSGLIIQGLPITGISAFTLESYYIDASCSDGTRFNASSEGFYSEVFKGGLRFHNTSWPFKAPVAGTGVGLIATSSFFMDTSSSELLWEPELQRPLNLIYASNLGDPDRDFYGLELFNCSLAVARVESDISCDGISCNAKRMRRSEVDTRSLYTMPFTWTEYENMLLFLPFVAGIMRLQPPSPIDQYMLGSNSPIMAGNAVAPDFSGVTGQTFSKRLTTIFNTVWQSSLWPSGIARGATGNLSADVYIPAHIPSASTTATITRVVSVYDASYLFIGLLLIITLVLQACAIAGLVLKYTATAPDILGYVSTMTRDNPHVVLPNGGHTLDGLERARRLAKMKVQLADINWDQAEGHLAFVNMDRDTDFSKGKLSKKKLYV